MFSRSKPEWEGLSRREKKTVKDNKKTTFAICSTWQRFSGKCHVISYKATKSELIELLSSWSARGACALHVTCTLVLEVLSLLSSIIIFLFSLFPSSLFFFLVPTYFFPLKFVSGKNKENPWNQDTCYNRRTVWIMDSHYYPTHIPAS